MRSAATPRTLARLLGAAVLTAWASSAAAQIYAGPAPSGEGAVVLSNFMSDAAPTLLIGDEAAPPAAGRPVDAPRAVPAARPAPAVPLVSLIKTVAKEHRLSESLLKAVIAAESAFDPRAVSPRGARGLMQLMPETARRWGAVDSFAADQNLRAGAAYLRWLLDLFGDDVQLALAGYNAGEGAVLRAGRRIPDIDETRRYVPKVLAYEAHYAGRR